MMIQSYQNVPEDPVLSENEGDIQKLQQSFKDIDDFFNKS